MDFLRQILHAQFCQSGSCLGVNWEPLKATWLCAGTARGGKAVPTHTASGVRLLQFGLQRHPAGLAAPGAPQDRQASTSGPASPQNTDPPTQSCLHSLLPGPCIGGSVPGLTLSFQPHPSSERQPPPGHSCLTDPLVRSQPPMPHGSHSGVLFWAKSSLPGLLLHLIWGHSSCSFCSLHPFTHLSWGGGVSPESDKNFCRGRALLTVL